MKSQYVGQDEKSGNIDWQTNPSTGNSEGSSKSEKRGISEDISRLKTHSDIQDWQCYPSSDTQMESSAAGKPLSITPDVDGHQNDKGWEQRRPSVSPNTQSIPYGPTPPPAAKP